MQCQIDAQSEDGRTAIVRLSAALVRLSANSCRAVSNHDSRLDLVAMLASGAGPAEELQLAVLQQAFFGERCGMDFSGIHGIKKLRLSDPGEFGKVPPARSGHLARQEWGLMEDVLHFGDLQIGDRWVSRARTVTETDVVNFACLTGDHDPLHTDHEFARQTPFGRPIAHGLLGLSLVAGLGFRCPAVNTLALVAVRDWQFQAPIYIGDTVHAVTEIVEKHGKGRRRGRVVWKRQLVNHKGEVVQSGILETIVAAQGVSLYQGDGKQGSAEDSSPHADAETAAVRSKAG
jgi:acyl dehydratase